MDSRYLKLAAVGTAAGAFSGLFGVGGGTIIVPLLILWFGYGEREATGTSLAAIVIIAALAATGQGAYGNVDVVNGLAIGIPAVAGVIAGTALQQRIPQVRRLLPLRAGPGRGRRRAAGHMRRLMDILLAILVGVAGGFLGGLVGVGGGILFVPALVFFLDEPQVRAEATSLLAIVIVAIAGTWRQHGYGNVRLGDAAIIGALSRRRRRGRGWWSRTRSQSARSRSRSRASRSAIAAQLVRESPCSSESLTLTRRAR